MFFGAYGDDNGLGGPTPEQTATAEAMEDLLLTFMRDPWNGPEAAGWPRFDTGAEGGGIMLRFGADGKPVQQVNADDVQGKCFGKGEYDPFP